MHSKDYQRNRRASFIAKGLCAYCGKNPKGATLACALCLQKPWRTKQYSTEQHQEVKKLCFDAYGGRFCICCGENGMLFLGIDHINNNGAEHRRSIFGQSRGGNIYTWLRARNFPPGFQVLCHNCNLAKHLNKGSCPHQMALTSLASA